MNLFSGGISDGYAYNPVINTLCGKILKLQVCFCPKAISLKDGITSVFFTLVSNISSFLINMLVFNKSTGCLSINPLNSFGKILECFLFILHVNKFCSCILRTLLASIQKDSLWLKL